MSGAHDQFYRHLHGWTVWDVVVELLHHIHESVAPTVASVHWAVSTASEFYFAKIFGWMTIVYALACVLWIIFLPSSRLPKLFGRWRYAFALSATVFYYRGVIFSLGGWKLVLAIATYVYLVTQRVEMFN